MKFDLAGRGDGVHFPLVGVLKMFTLEKKRVQNGKPEFEGGDARAATMMERGLGLHQTRSQVPAPAARRWPRGGLGQASPCAQHPHVQREIAMPLGEAGKS